MTPVLLTFVVVLLFTLGVYWILVVRPEQHSAETLWRRLRVSGHPKTARLGLTKTAQRLSAIPSFDSVLSRSRSVLGPVERLISQSGSQLTVGTVILSCGCAGVIVFALVNFLTRVPLLSLGVGALCTWIPIAYLGFQRSRRMIAFEEQFPEALDLLSRALRAGHAFTTGVAMVADEMPKPVGPEFRLLYDQQNFGMPLPEALKAFGSRIPLIDARFFVTAVLTQREAGGNLSEVLDNLASVIRSRFKVKRQIRVISAHGRLTGLVLVAVPPALAVVLFTINPSHFTVLWTDPIGLRIIYFALFLQITGGLIIRKLVRIEY